MQNQKRNGQGLQHCVNQCGGRLCLCATIAYVRHCAPTASGMVRAHACWVEGIGRVKGGEQQMVRGLDARMPGTRSWEKGLSRRSRPHKARSAFRTGHGRLPGSCARRQWPLSTSGAPSLQAPPAPTSSPHQASFVASFGASRCRVIGFKTLSPKPYAPAPTMFFFSSIWGYCIRDRGMVHAGRAPHAGEGPRLQCLT